MESLIKQTRRKFAGTRQENKESRGTVERKIPPQKTLLSGERKRSQSWLRQFSRQMSWEYDFSALDYPTAVAAAAYAIQSLEESKSRDQNLTTYGPDKSLNKMRSRAEDTEETLRRNYKDPDIKMPISASRSKKMTEKAADPGPPSKDKISFVDTNKTTSKKPANSAGQMAPERAPSMGRPPTFADKHLDIGESEKPETPQPKSDSPPTRWSTTQPVDPRRQTATKPGPADSMADAWEKEKMASIQERYERLTAIIDDWEINKKKKANRKMERIEAKPENKRAEAVQRHQEEIKRIEEIAGGARAQAEKNRRKEELKVKEKANKIRSTGKLPATCLCF
ncbi:uncharacterized protein LOC105156505 [Sesamum indicum]|uniref:Uncharacterized protein LOC105156505 n=1 Tax=Sesamum indicum TaxID=4182 RepID=A0A6I9SLZ3_SESIN|nr:uncharacterized protein LOC105156505 [Sesamum indicum]